MNRLIIQVIVFLALTACLTGFAEGSGQEMPEYSISIIDISPSSDGVDKSSDVTALFGNKKISGIGSEIKSDGKIPVVVTNRVELTWDPKTYSPVSVSDTWGDAIGSSSDVEKKDDLSYLVESENVTAHNSSAPYTFVTDVTFAFDVPTAYQGKVRDMYVSMYAKSGTKIKVRMYNGDEWKIIRTVSSSSWETTEFSVGGEYIDENEVYVRIYTESNNSHEVEVDYIALMFRYTGMDVSFNLPSGSGLVDLDDCCDGDLTVDYTKSANTVTFDLSDYVGFDDNEFNVDYSYVYNLTVSGYYVKQKNKLIISSEDSSSSEDIGYEKYFYVSSPFSQTLKIEAAPNMPLRFDDLRGADSAAYSVTKESGKLRFEVENSGGVNLTYALLNALSVKKDLYGQSSFDVSSPSWVSKYSLSRGQKADLGALLISHKMVSNSSDAKIAVSPSVDYSTKAEGGRLNLSFSEFASDLVVTVTESSGPVIANKTSAAQARASVEANVPISFRAALDIKNPLNKEMEVVLSRDVVSDIFPDLINYFDEGGDTKPVVLKAGEVRTVPVYFTLPAIVETESAPVQTIVAVNQPVEWKKKIKLTNPGGVSVENISFNVSVPAEAADFSLGGTIMGENVGGIARFVVPGLSAKASKEYEFIYYGLPVTRNEEIVSGGILDAKTEKKVTLVNQNSEAVKVKVFVNVSGMGAIDGALLEQQVGGYKEVDRDGDGVVDSVSWDAEFEGDEEKVIVLSGAKTDVFAGIGSGLGSIGEGLGSVDFSVPEGGDMMIPLVVGGLVLLVVLIAVVYVRAERKNRRKKMILYIAATNDAMKKLGGQQGVNQPTK